MLFGLFVAEYLSDCVALFKLGHELFHLVNFFIQLGHLLVVRVIFLILIIDHWDVSSYGFTRKVDSLEITFGV